MKQQLYREIDPVLPAAAVVASSTSALCMSDLQQGLVNRGRYVVGHPFNPVHLIPAVEVVGGRETDSATVEWASTFYRKLGKQVIRLHKEMPGHLIDRLQGAIFREALHVVMEGIADVEAVDRGIAYGPGLRWSLMGIFLTWHLAAGPGGMRDYLTRYSDTFERMWKDLGSPHITPDVVERIVAGVAAETRGRTVQELIEERDALLVPLLTTLSAKGTKLSGESSASWWTR